MAITVTELRKAQSELKTKALRIRELLASPSEVNVLRAEIVDSEATALEEQLDAGRRQLAVKSTSLAKLNDYRPVTQPTYHRVLKSITGATAAEASQKAYRFGRWLQASLFQHAPAIRYCDEQLGIKTHREDTNTLGGFLIPEAVITPLLESRERQGVFRANARNVVKRGDVVNTPRLVGNLSSYWLGEGSSLTESEQAFAQIQLVSKKLGCLMLSSEELSDDSVVELADEFVAECSFAFATKEDQCGFLGTGESDFRGMVGACHALQSLDSSVANISGLVTASGSGYASSYGSVTLADFHNVMARLPAFADTPRCAWYMNKNFYHAVAQRLAAAAGNGVEKESLPASASQAPRNLFLGYPCNFTQCLPKTSAVSQVVCLFGDLYQSSLFLDSRSIRVRVTPHLNFNKGQLTFAATERFDARTWNIGNANSDATLRESGAIVGLVTGSS